MMLPSATALNSYLGKNIFKSFLGFIFRRFIVHKSYGLLLCVLLSFFRHSHPLYALIAWGKKADYMGLSGF